MTVATPQQALALLVEKRRQLGERELNEAATRLELIDTMLREVLGWRVEEFNPEEHVSAGQSKSGKKVSEWLDYHLRSGETTRLVVEAKRAGSTFSLPVARKQRRHPLDALAHNHGTALAKAIAQARRYCLRVGTYAFAVTNGTQWIVSMAFAHNVAADKINAIVFYDLEDVQANLSEFVDLLSPEGLAAQTIMTVATSGASLVPTFAKRPNDVFNHRPGEGKNYLSQPMVALMRACFGDLTDEDHADMLGRCYVSTEVTEEYVARLESFVGETLPSTVDQSATKVDRRATAAADFEDATRTTGEAVLLVGRVGSGKSTFIAVTKQRLASKYGRSDSVVLHVDLVTSTFIHAKHFEHERLVDEICSSLLVQAEQEFPDLNPFENKLLKDVFAGEIRRMRSSLSEETRNSERASHRADEVIQEHLRKPLHHLKAWLGYLDRKGVRATLFLDNVDRGTEEFEKVLLQLAKTLAKHSRATVVTSLRDTTYHHGKTGGFLDVGRHTVFTISPPPFREVARLRFDYVRERMRGNDSALSRRFLRACGKTPVDSVFQFAATLSDILLGDSPEVQACIQALAGTNIRRALEFLEDFAVSPSTDLNRIFSISQQAERRGRPDYGPVLDLFVRSVMQMSTGRYSERESKIFNLFQVLTSVLTSHFDAIRVLQLLRARLSAARESPDMLVSAIVGHLGAIGHASAGVKHVIDQLGRYGLTNSMSRPEPPWRDSDTVRLGASGRYYLDALLFNREYIQNVVDDTVIYDDGVIAALDVIRRDKMRTFPQRLEDKSRTFLTYLIRREDAELSNTRGARPHWVQPVAELIAAQHFGTSFVQEVRAKARRK